MNVKRLELMVTMLKEVEAGTWKASESAYKELIASNNLNILAFNKQMPNSVEEVKEKPSSFDLDNWVDGRVRTNQLNCGFSACAVGHATLDARFNKLGLTAYPTSLSPCFAGDSSWSAVKSFFSLDVYTVDSLFLGRRFPQHLKEKALVVQVRRRIEKLLELGEEKYLKTNLIGKDADLYLVSPKGRIYKEYKNV